VPPGAPHLLRILPDPAEDRYTQTRHTDHQSRRRVRTARRSPPRSGTQTYERQREMDHYAACRQQRAGEPTPTGGHHGAETNSITTPSPGTT